MTSLPRCTPACDYVPLAQYENVRPPPWTVDDAGLTFHCCRRCGSISIQRFNASSGFGQIWMLEADAMTLIRRDAMPSSVIAYLRTEDFFNNRGITEGLFRGYLGFVADLSWPANALISMLGNTEEPKRATTCLGMISSVFDEARRRDRLGIEFRCVLATIRPIADKLRPPDRPNDDPAIVANLRLAALSALEKLGEPALWDSVDMNEAALVEEMIDHKSLLARSRHDLIEARKFIDGDGLLWVQSEAKYLLEVFRHREAHLTEILGSLYWACMRDIRLRIQGSHGRPETLQRTYQQLQQVLEHQIMSMGLERDASLDRHGRAFIEPRTGVVVRIRTMIPEVSVYRNSTTYDPIAIFESWHDVTTFIIKARER